MIERGDPPHIGFHSWSLHAPWTKSACNMPLHLGCGMKSVSLGMFILKIKTSLRNAHGIDVASEVCKQTMHFCKLAFVTPTNLLFWKCCALPKIKTFFGFRRPGPTAQILANKGILRMFVAQTRANMNLIEFLRCCFAPPSNWNVFNQAWISLIQLLQNATKIVNLKCFQINFVNFDQSFPHLSQFWSIWFPPPSSPWFESIKSTWISLSQLWLICKRSGTCVMAKPLQRIHCKWNWKKNNAQLCDMTIYWHQNRQITTLIQLLYPNTRKPPFWSNFCDVMTFWWFLTQKNQKKAILAKEGFFCGRGQSRVSRD